MGTWKSGHTVFFEADCCSASSSSSSSSSLSGASSSPAISSAENKLSVEEASSSSPFFPLLSSNLPPPCSNLSGRPFVFLLGSKVRESRCSGATTESSPSCSSTPCEIPRFFLRRVWFERPLVLLLRKVLEPSFKTPPPDLNENKQHFLLDRAPGNGGHGHIAATREEADHEQEGQGQPLSSQQQPPAESEEDQKKAGQKRSAAPAPLAAIAATRRRIGTRARGAAPPQGDDPGADAVGARRPWGPRGEKREIFFSPGPSTTLEPEWQLP